MKKPTYYNVENPDNELSVFINKNNEISIVIENNLYSIISLSKKDILDLSFELESLANEIE